MNSSYFESTPLLQGITAVSGMYIVLIMTLMCLIMYSKQRKKAYLYMIAAFVFIMTYEGFNIHYAFTDLAESPSYLSWLPWLQSVSFILLNTSIYLLYRRLKRKGYLLLGAALLLSAVPLLVFPADALNSESWQDISLLIYRWVLIMIAFIFIYPRVGQRGKYILSLVVYAAALLLTSILKPAGSQHVLHNISLFLPLIYYTLTFFILFERIVELMQSIYRSSITDGLTSLYNRRFFTKHLAKYVSEGLKVSVIFCDIDNFKKLNDTQGHAKADEVLKQVAAIIDEEVSDIGLAGRYGGEELVAAIVDKRAKPAVIAEQIRARIEAETIVTVSVGYSTLRKNVSVDQLVSQADQAMYRSKTTGKNKVSSFYAKKESNPI